MTYTPPSASSITASWSAAGTYSPPSSGALVASFSGGTTLQADAFCASPAILHFAECLAHSHSSARASAESLMGQPSMVAAHLIGCHAEAPTPLTSGSVLVSSDFTGFIGDVATIYLMDLVTPGGLVRAPISSWQATLQTGGKCYVQAVIPASTQYADAINAASEFVISRAAVLPSGMQIEQEMARAPVLAQFDRGSMRETCTISGYSDGFAESENPSPQYDRTLANIRSVSSGAGGMRVRCAVDWLLRPGQRAYANGVPMIADYINYYAPTGGDSYMDVGERA